MQGLLLWLFIVEQIIFKVEIITFKCMYGISPMYLRDALNMCLALGNFKFISKNILFKPRIRFETYGGRSFAFTFPSARNVLSEHVKRKSFESLLKLNVFIFEIAFHIWRVSNFFEIFLGIKSGRENVESISELYKRNICYYIIII